MAARTENVYIEVGHAIKIIFVEITVMNWHPMVLCVVCVVNFFSINDMLY